MQDQLETLDGAARADRIARLPHTPVSNPETSGRRHLLLRSRPVSAVGRSDAAYAGPVAAILNAWLASLGVDFFVHGGLLARVYAVPTPFLLPLHEAFRRIPLGYLAFLLLTAALYWLSRQLDVRGFRKGLLLGLGSGGVVGASLVLGLLSISTAGTELLLVWGIGQTVELGAAGGVIGALAAGVPPRRMLLWTILTVAGLFVLTVLFQTFGLSLPIWSGTP
jgi:hypothetical protein